MNSFKILASFCASLLVFSINETKAQSIPTTDLGIRLQGYAYPYPIKYFDLTIENKNIQMAYMDIEPLGKPLNQTIILLHGGLSFGAYWKDVIKFLSERGFRVIVPDQIGFGKSSKSNIHYSLHLLANNTKRLLDYLGIKNAIMVGHSLGGMVAVRFALMYPDTVSKLILEDPLGLEDYRLKIPYKTTDEVYELSLHPTWENILNTQKSLYVNWNDKYEEYAQVAYRVSLNPKFSKVALTQALIYEMIYSEPVAYEIENISIPTLLIYGSEDRTVPGKAFASEEIQKTLGNFPRLANQTISKMPHAEIKEFKNVGHVPHLEATDEFNFILEKFLAEKVK